MASMIVRWHIVITIIIVVIIIIIIIMFIIISSSSMIIFDSSSSSSSSSIVYYHTAAIVYGITCANPLQIPTIWASVTMYGSVAGIFVVGRFAEGSRKRPCRCEQAWDHFWQNSRTDIDADALHSVVT